MAESSFLWSLIWLAVLITIAFWVAGFAAPCYIILLPFTVYIQSLESTTKFLLKAVEFPFYCAKMMKAGKSIE
ncbi:hypothetical protein JYU34_004576 [Plutella xylostella]|uniref:Uncharacterized protein n=2 Tax=Plutella xylostella TaxID=51655 RepID=A0ABQ7QYB9_PLUXY|nr:hypothetical protein JYU34_004576 [Plutella xylostella]CAG9121045.1 unnamed protein product [Plutella xylostella]